MLRQWVRAGQEFLDSHPSAQRHKFFNSAAEWMLFELFYERLKERDKFLAFRDGGLFGDSHDCKQFLEDYFGVEI